MRIAVLKGGWSSERDISLRSATFVSNELRRAGHDVHEIDIIKDLKYITDRLYESSPSFIVNMLHGIGGEDGVIQGILEVFGIPYSGSRVLGSSIAFHKSICKTIVKSNGVKVVDGFDIHSTDIQYINTLSGIQVSYPFVVKPAANGSSVGVFLIFNDGDLKKLKDISWTFGDDVILEQYIYGREFTVLVNDGKSVGALEIIPNSKFYDYGSKYDIGGSSHVLDFDLDTALMEQMLSMAETAFKVCHCCSFTRVDFKISDDNIYFLEINTQPGMTNTSLVPEIAKYSNIELIDILDIKNSVY
ncbi:MAG: D-alanine--D-alanine ligase [Holosporales bacterium]|jgi:D-alanine-D-alanine ligase|nr:D-alanine--D-alanine ligase [Holosporales bacterium]